MKNKLVEELRACRERPYSSPYKFVRRNETPFEMAPVPIKWDKGLEGAPVAVGSDGIPMQAQQDDSS